MNTVFAQLEFAAPFRLIVLALLPALIWIALRGRRRPRWQMLSSTGLRCLLMVLLCVAWAGPSCRRASQRQFVVFAVDDSLSCQADASDSGQSFLQQSQTDTGENIARWMTFDQQPARIQTEIPLANRPNAVSKLGTNIAAAVELAESACPANLVPHVVLLSDGLETEGNVLTSAAAARIPISVVPLAAFSQPEIAIDAIDAPARLSPHESAEAVVTIAANHNDTVDVKFLRNGELVAARKVEVSPGLNPVRFETVLPSNEIMRLQAELSGGEDTFAQNNSLGAIVLPGERVRILIVGGESAAVENLLTVVRENGIDVERTTPQRVDASSKDLEPFSLIVLTDVAASELGPQRLSALDAYVRHGGGLLVVGGERVFGASAYELTALEKMLPVVATEQPVEQQKSLALVLVIDKSKSMEQENRLGLAKEAAKKVADVLQSRDQVGVLAFGDDSQWINRLAPLSNKEELLTRIDGLEASGATNMYPALERAYLSLSQADADSRHVILLTDGVPTPGDFDEVAQRMADAGITVSTVSLGKGADQTILAQIARIARGTHHHVDDPSDLPSILEREAQTAASKVSAGRFSVQAPRQLPGLDVADAPPISGYVATNFKPGAQLLLTAGEGDPLLAWWRHGRGEAMVITSDLVSSSPKWQAWPGYADFWLRLVTHAMRRSEPQREEFFVRQENGRVIVTFDATARPHAPIALDDGQANLAVMKVVDGQTSDTLVMMPQVRPGIYEASFGAAPGEAVLLDVGRQSGDETLFQAKLGFYIRYPVEYRLRETDEVKLQTIASATGGKFNPQPGDVFVPDGRTVDVLHPLWPHLLIAALLVYLADVVARRWPSGQFVSTAQPKRRAA